MIDILIRLLLSPFLLCAIAYVVLIDIWQAGVEGALWNLGHNLVDGARWVATGREFG